jgi:hypothetical protein
MMKTALSAFVFAACMHSLHPAETITSQISKQVKCGAHTYFDSTMLACLTCPDHMTPNTTETDVNGNFLGCNCEIGYEKVSRNCDQVYIIYI